MKKKDGWQNLGIFFSLVSIIFICIGFYWLYVGTIAADQAATAYFCLAIFFILLSTACGIFYYLTNLPIIMKTFGANEENNSADEKRSCPNCGNLNNAENKFCNKCGTELNNRQ